ncbi:MAG: lipid-A-disaccharide synthase, partial [Bdellovibrionales bacterium]
AVSGTVGLELAYMDVPHVIAYKTSPVTAAVVKSMAKVKYVHLANILLDQAVVPEYLQGQCSPIEIAKACMRFLRDPQKGADQQAQFAVLREKLHEGINQSPSDTAAGFVLKQLT